MKKAMLLVVLLCLLAGLGATAGVFTLSSTSTSVSGARVHALAADPQPFITQGKAYLQAHSLLAARDQFALAVGADPTNQEANLLLGVTRVFAILENSSAPTAGLDSIRQVMELSGFSFQNFGVYGMEGTGPDGLAATTPRTGAVLDFIKANALPEINLAVANLGVVTSSFAGSSIAPAAIAGTGANLSIDYADALVIKSLLNVLKCNLNLLMVYGLDVSLPDISAAPEQLLTYKQLFADGNLLSVKDAASLDSAKTALSSFITNYQQALLQLPLRGTATTHLFVLDQPVTNEPFELSSKGLNKISSVLTEIASSLNGPTLFTGGSAVQDRTIDLSKFFNSGSPIVIRNSLADCTGGIALPDPTFGGLLPQGLSTRQEIVDHAGSYLLAAVCPNSNAPMLKASPGYLGFWNAVPGIAQTQSVTISNRGTAPLHVSSASLSAVSPAAAFTLDKGTCSSLTPTLQAGTSCALNVTQSASVYGNLNAQLLIAADDLSNPTESVNVSGYRQPPPGGTISGRMKDAATGQGISGVVYFYDAVQGYYVGGVSVDSLAGFSIGGLTVGSYKAYFSANDGLHISQWYNGMPSQASATPIALGSANFVLADARLAQGGSVSGAVKDASTGLGIPGASITLYDSLTNAQVAWGATASDGYYSIGQVPAGSYKVRFSTASGYQAQWYNQGALVAVAAAVNTPLTDVLMVTPPGTFFTWAGVTYLTYPDGVTAKYNIDLGLPALKNPSTLGALKVQATGPAGFSYSFGDADLSSGAGDADLWKEFPTLTPGLYSFTVSDGKGNSATRVDRLTNPHLMPVVDSTTIQHVRKSDGSYHFTWAPVASATLYYYRLTVNDANGSEVFSSDRKFEVKQDVPAGTLTNGAIYYARVEVHDAPSFDQLNNRSNSNWVSFTPVSSDYDASRLMVNYAFAANRYDNAGVLSSDLNFSVGTVEAAAALTSVTVTGPNNFLFPFNLNDPALDANSNKQANGFEFNQNYSAPLVPGPYVFHIVANGQTQTVYTVLQPANPMASFDSSKYKAQDLGNGNVRFSWVDVNYTGALYYRVYLRDSVSGLFTNTTRANQTYVDIPTATLNTFNNRQWRVEAYDTSSGSAPRNRRNGPLVSLNILPYDASALVSNGCQISHVTNFDNSDWTYVWSGAQPAAGSLTQLRMTGPNNFSRDLLVKNDFLEAGNPAAGLYTCSATDSLGKTVASYNLQPAAHTIPPVDLKTVNVGTLPSGDVSLSWAPVANDIPVWYAVDFLQTSRVNGVIQESGINVAVSSSSYYLSDTTLDIPAATLPSGPFSIRIYALDGSDGSSYNNYSRSITFGYQGAGFNYASLSDADGDGYASNAFDSTPPVIQSFVVPAASNTASVNLTTLSATDNVAVTGYLVSESPSTPAANAAGWSATGPGSYTFASAGSHTLYAFAKDGNGNVSAYQSATVLITLPLVVQDLGTGSGTVTSSVGISCLSGNTAGCSANVSSNQVELFASPGSSSTFGGWSANCTVTATGSCLVAMVPGTTVTGTFTLAPLVKIGTTAYATLQAAYDAAVDGAVIKMLEGSFIGSLTTNRSPGVTLAGGYNAAYSAVVGETSLVGQFRLRAGKLKTLRVNLK